MNAARGNIAAIETMLTAQITAVAVTIRRFGMDMRLLWARPVDSPPVAEREQFQFMASRIESERPLQPVILPRHRAPCRPHSTTMNLWGIFRRFLRSGLVRA